MNILSEKNIIEQINQIDWNEYIVFEYCNKEKAISAIRSLINLKNESEKNKTYNDVLYTVGNNHRGTYYPMIKEILPIIINLAEKSEFEIVRNCSLEVIIDLYCFEPELYSYNKISHEDLLSFVKTIIQQFLKQHKRIDSDRNILLIVELDEYILEESNF